MVDNRVRAVLDTVHRIEMREMFGWLSHELAQPLAAMGAYTGAAVRLLGEPGAPRARAALEQSLGQIDRARDTVRSVRARFAAPASLRLETAPCVREAMDAAGLAEAVLVVASDAPSCIVTSPAELQTVLFHLLRNALEATPAGAVPAVHVSAAADPHGIRVAVTNPSAASPEECWFDAFHTTKPGHLGLGLTIARRLCDALGARLDAAATGSGEVSFRLQVPGRS